ncbi:MAG: MFS transporter [Thermoprotei archaeon]|nr:MAG: MFS transporter [Thermoprotei archaeon]
MLKGDVACVRDWLGLARVGNCLIISLAAYTGYLLGGGVDSTTALLLSTAVALVAAGGNILNDYYDREVDSVSKPWRPLPSGRISPRAALVAAASAFTLGVLTSFYVSTLCGLTAALASLMLHLYSWRVKRMGFPGNLLIAFLSALSVAYGALASPRPHRSLLPAIYAFLIISGREVMKGIEDLEGDRRIGVRTIAVVKGPGAALKVSSLLLLSVVAISPIPMLVGYGLLYAFFAFMGVDAPIVTVLLYVRRDPVSRAWSATRILKIPLFSGLLAFLLGG